MQSEILNTIQRLHSELKLCFQVKDALFAAPEAFLVYLLCILRHEIPFLPEKSFKEWTDFLTLLIPHKMLPLLYWKISHLPKNHRPPEPIFNKMRVAFMTGCVHALQAERQLRELLDSFSKAGVRVLVLKGPALARTVYPDTAIRSSNDIDLLVRPKEFPKACEIFKTGNYQRVTKNFEILKDVYCEEIFIPRPNLLGHNFGVEVHWDAHRFFGYERRNNIEDLFSRAVKIETPNLTFETLDTIDSLIHAALHLIMSHSQHMCLIWIYDIALLAHDLSSSDWEELQKRSSAWGSRFSVVNSLKMAQIWAGLQLPIGFNDLSIWPQPTNAELKAVSNAIHKYDRPFNLLKLYLSKSSSITKKFHVLLKLLFPDPDYIRIVHPSNDWLLPFSYLRRLRRWW